MFESADDSYSESDWLKDPLSVTREGEKQAKVQDNEVPDVGAEIETAGEDQSEELVHGAGAWALETFNAAYEQDVYAGVADWINRHAPEV